MMSGLKRNYYKSPYATIYKEVLLMLFRKIKEQEAKRERANRNLACLQSVFIGQAIRNFQESTWHPERYVDGSSKDFAKITLKDLEELRRYDPEAAEFLEDVYRVNFQLIREALNEGG